MAKRTKEEQALLDKEYQKQLRNLKRRIQRKVNAGYIVPDNIIPKRPKVINPESITNLTKRTGEYIARKSVYIMPTGKKIKGEERLKQERSERSKKAAETRKSYYEAQKEANNSSTQRVSEEANNSLIPQVSNEPVYELETLFQKFIDIFESWVPEDIYSSNIFSEDLKTYKQRDKDRALGIINGAREQLGITQVAMNIQNNANRLNELAVKILYESGNKYHLDSRNGEINLALNELTAILYGRSLTVSESLRLTEISESNEVF